MMSVRLPQLCERYKARKKPFDKKPDHPKWIQWKLTDESWEQWRQENPEEVHRIQEILKSNPEAQL